MAGDAFQTKLDNKLSAYRAWSAGRKLSHCRLVQYCGVDLVGALDVPLGAVETRITGLVCEGFYVDWTEHNGRLYLRVWEYDGPEPNWTNVFAEKPLVRVDQT